MTSALWILVDALVGIPSLGLYVFILGTLCDRHYKRLYFHSSFYRLVTLTAIVVSERYMISLADENESVG